MYLLVKVSAESFTLPSRIAAFGSKTRRKFFICHTSLKCARNSFICNTSKTRGFKSFVCHTSEPPPGMRETLVNQPPIPLRPLVPTPIWVVPLLSREELPTFLGRLFKYCFPQTTRNMSFRIKYLRNAILVSPLF